MTAPECLNHRLLHAFNRLCLPLGPGALNGDYLKYWSLNTCFHDIFPSLHRLSPLVDLQWCPSVSWLASFYWSGWLMSSLVLFYHYYALWICSYSMAFEQVVVFASTDSSVSSYQPSHSAQASPSRKTSMIKQVFLEGWCRSLHLLGCLTCSLASAYSVE